MKTLSILLLLLVNYANAYSYKTSLSDIGFEDGVVSQARVNSHSVYFNLPENSLIKGGSFHVKLSRAPFLTKSSHIKVLASGEVIGYVTQKDTVLPISKKLLKGGSVKIDFEFYTDFASGKICDQSPVFKGLFEIKENSFLNVDLTYRPKTINDFLMTLPKSVVVTTPDRELTQREFVFITFLKRHLNERKKELVFNFDQSKGTTFFIGNSEEIRNYYSSFQKKENDFEFAIKRIYTKKFSFLAFNSDLMGDEVNTIDFFSNGFNARSVKSLSGLTVSRVESKKKKFEKIAADTWQLHYKNSDLAGPFVIDSIDLSLMALSDKKRHNIFLSIFKEDKLVKAIELGTMKESEIFNIDIPKGLLNKDSNIYIQASVKGSFATQGECVSSGAGIQLSILPDTKVNFSPFHNDQTFMNFARSSAGEYNVHLPKKWLSDFRNGIDHTVKLINSIGMNPKDINFSFFEETIDLNEKNNFVLSSGDMNFDGPHKLNANKFNVNYIEIANINEKKFFHYQVGNYDVKSSIQFLPIDSKDLTYFDGSRVLYTVNSTIDKSFKVEYSNPNNLKAILKKYKFVIFGLLWVFLTFIFIRFAKRRK